MSKYTVSRFTRIKDRIHGVFVLMKHALMLIVGYSDALVVQTGKVRNMKEGEMASHTFILGDVRVAITMMESVAEKQRKLVEEKMAGIPKELMDAIREKIAALRGENPDDIKIFQATPDGLVAAHTTPGCDCPVCRTARVETGEATPADRAKMN